jgi:hypothetical protein
MDLLKGAVALLKRDVRQSGPGVDDAFAIGFEGALVPEDQHVHQARMAQVSVSTCR